LNFDASEAPTAIAHKFEQPVSKFQEENKEGGGWPPSENLVRPKAALAGPQRLLRIIHDPFSVFVEPSGTAAFADIPDEIAGISRDVGLGQFKTPGAVQTKVSHVCLRNEKICYPKKG
jgi:hypothetical protein